MSYLIVNTLTSPPETDESFLSPETSMGVDISSRFNVVALQAALDSPVMPVRFNPNTPEHILDYLTQEQLFALTARTLHLDDSFINMCQLVEQDSFIRHLNSSREYQGLPPIDIDSSTLLKTIQLLFCDALDRTFALSNELRAKSIQYLQNLLLSLNGTLDFLDRLDLSRTDVSNEELKTLLMTATKLTSLHLTECKKVNGTTFQNLPPGTNYNLEEISLSGTKISKSAVRRLIAAAPCLEKIYLWNCPNIGKGLFSNLPPLSLFYLEEIDLSHTKITHDDLKDLLETGKRLKKIYVHGCPNINPDIAQSMIQRTRPEISLIFRPYG